MIRITLKGGSETANLLQKFSERLRIAILRAMRESAILIQGLAKVKAPVFRGLLRVSILQGITEEGGKLVGHVGSALAYAPVLESGRTTGWLPPISELKVWARRKLGDERLAFVVGRAIKRRGFKAQPYLLPALETGASRVQTIFESRLREAIQAEGGNA